ncbi:MAG: hypothetical protein R2932_26650 [Caldilineaceae bacterium]
MMTNRSNITYRPCQPTDAQAISDFLLTIGDELTIRDECEAAEMIALLFAKGGMLGAYREEQLIGVLGYFFGEPACDYANREIGFIYLAALAKPYRLSRVFQNALFYAFQFLRELGVQRCAFMHGNMTAISIASMRALPSRYAKRLIVGAIPVSSTAKYCKHLPL